MKIALILVPIVLIGAFFGLAITGVLKVPGITPVKKAAPKKDDPKKTDGAPAPADAQPATPPPTSPPPATKKPSLAAATTTSDPQPDQVAGAKKVANIWSEMPIDQVAKMAVSMKDPDLALILRQMDEEDAAKVLELLPPARALSLSKTIESQAAKDAAKAAS